METNKEQEDISQYPRFTTFKKEEKQLLKNGFTMNTFMFPATIFDNKKQGYRAYVTRMKENHYEIFTYKMTII